MTFFLDTFTDVNLTPLNSHTSDSGATTDDRLNSLIAILQARKALG